MPIQSTHRRFQDTTITLCAAMEKSVTHESAQMSVTPGDCHGPRIRVEAGSPMKLFAAKWWSGSNTICWTYCRQ